MRTAFEDDGSDCMGFMLFFPACHGLHWIDNIFNSLCVFLLLSLLLSQSVYTEASTEAVSHTDTHLIILHCALYRARQP